MTSFGERLRAAIDARGPLCIGIDPHASLLADWGLPVSADGCREFGLRVVDAAADRVGVVKPQVSFFERWGAAGYAALESVLAAGRSAGLVVIADAKRGDIGTTMDAYAHAWLESGSALEADALTVNPYLGVGALTATFDLAVAHGKGVFALAATSNPEARTLQYGDGGRSRPVPRLVIDDVDAWARERVPAGEWSSVGVVIGATVDLEARGLDAPFAVPAPILAPGFGAQGAEPAELADRFGPLAPYVLASESRSILDAGPDRLAARIAERAAAYREVPRG